MKAEKAGEWAFLLCVIIAVLAGIGATALGATASAGALSWITLLLVILGVVVGLTTVTEKEITPFLVATIALVITSTAIFSPIDQAIPYLGTLLDNIVGLIAVFVAPAAVILSVKAIYALASKR